MTAPRMPQHVQTGLGVLVACVVAAGVIRFVYLPAGVRLGERRASLKELAANIADAKLLAERLPQEQAALDQTRERYRSLVERRIDRGLSLARVLETLSAQAQDRRLELVAMQPNTSDKTMASIELGQELRLEQTLLTLGLAGRYRSIGEFLGWLQQAPFVASVRTLTLSRPEDNTLRVHADVELAVYLAGAGALP